MLLFLSCFVISLAPALALFLRVVARRALLVIIAIGAAFFMLLALLLSSLLWWLRVTVLIAVASVALQEASRFAFYQIYAFAVRRGLLNDSSGGASASRPALLEIAVSVGWGMGTIRNLVLFVAPLSHHLGPGVLIACEGMPSAYLSALHALLSFLAQVLLSIYAFHAYAQSLDTRSLLPRLVALFALHALVPVPLAIFASVPQTFASVVSDCVLGLVAGVLQVALLLFLCWRFVQSPNPLLSLRRPRAL